MAWQEFKELKVGQKDMKQETANFPRSFFITSGNRICVLATGVVSSRDPHPYLQGSGLSGELYSLGFVQAFHFTVQFSLKV
jgi:hypothetical protein